ncbi:MAG TPA: hypothetical protein VF446_04210 [Trinickia sp.]
MRELLLSVASVDFGTYGTALATLTLLSILVCNAYKKKWGDIGEMIMAMLAAAGAVSGLKIVLLTYVVEASKLGALADDRAALFIGGAATFVLSLKEGAEKWKSAACI